MTMAIALCARVRVEETDHGRFSAGVLSMPVPRGDAIAPDPTPQDVQALINEAPGCQDAVPLVMIDRVQNPQSGALSIGAPAGGRHTDRFRCCQPT